MVGNRTQLEKTLSGNKMELTGLTGDLVSAGGHGSEAFYVTSARPDEGKTTVAAGMAYGLSLKAEDEVVLIEANINTPEFARMFGLEENPPGLFDYLLGNADMEEIVHRPEGALPPVIAAGSAEAGEVWLNSFEEASFREKLRGLTDRFLYSVFDGDSVLSSTGTAIHAHLFDGVILAVACNRTKWQVVDLARDKLVGYGAHVIGVALNKRKYPIPDAIYPWV